MVLGIGRRTATHGVAAAFVLAVGGVGLGSPSRADDTPRPPTLMVVGDSISATARYYGDGDPTKNRVEAWWQHVADNASSHGVTVGKVVLDAVPGSGMLARGVASGTQCSGQTFGERLPNIVDARPDVLVVAGGRNDYLYCKKGRLVTASTAHRDSAITGYLDALATTAAEAGLTPDDVYVTSPWGTDKAKQRAEIEPVLEAAAVSHGFHWVMLPVTPSADTVDGTHPNAAGTALIARRIEASSDLVARLESGGTTGAPVDPGTTVLCSGAKACIAAGMTDHGFGARANETFWGQPAGSSATSYVAYRLTHDGRATAYPAGATTAATWAQAAHDAGATLASSPHVGDVAWWPTGAGSSRVAIVEQIHSGAVVVSEGDGSRLRWVSESGAAYPRIFLRFARSSGTPTGTLRSVTQYSTHTLDIRGYASDPDAYDHGAQLRIVVTQHGHSSTHTLAAPTRFTFHRHVHVASLRRGAATVRVYALNAKGSAGAATARLGTVKVTIR